MAPPTSTDDNADANDAALNLVGDALAQFRTSDHSNCVRGAGYVDGGSDGGIDDDGDDDDDDATTAASTALHSAAKRARLAPWSPSLSPAPSPASTTAQDVFLVPPAEPHTASPPATPPLHHFGLADANAMAPVAADAASPLLLLSRLDRLAVSPPRVPLASLGGLSLGCSATPAASANLRLVRSNLPAATLPRAQSAAFSPPPSLLHRRTHAAAFRGPSAAARALRRALAASPTVAGEAAVPGLTKLPHHHPHHHSQPHSPSSCSTSAAANTATGLTRLPHELWLAIAHRAAPTDVARLRRVSRAVAAAASDPALWRRHCLAAGVDCDAVAAASASCPPSWSLVYARQHVLRRRLFRGGRCRARCINDAHALGVTAIDFVEPIVPRLSVTTEDSTPPQPPPRLLVTGSWDASLKLWRLVRDDPLTPRHNRSGGARLDARWSDAARYDDSDSDSLGSDNEDTADDVDAGAVAAAAWESANEDDDPAAAELGWWSAGPSVVAPPSPPPSEAGSRSRRRRRRRSREQQSPEVRRARNGGAVVRLELVLSAAAPSRVHCLRTHGDLVLVGSAGRASAPSDDRLMLYRISLDHHPAAVSVVATAASAAAIRLRALRHRSLAASSANDIVAVDIAPASHSPTATVADTPTDDVEGSPVAVSCTKGAITVWHLHSGSLLASAAVPEHFASFVAVAIVPRPLPHRGHLVVAAAAAGVVFIWTVPPLEELLRSGNSNSGSGSNISNSQQSSPSPHRHSCRDASSAEQTTTPPPQLMPMPLRLRALERVHPSDAPSPGSSVNLTRAVTLSTPPGILCATARFVAPGTLAVSCGFKDGNLREWVVPIEDDGPSTPNADDVGDTAAAAAAVTAAAFDLSLPPAATFSSLGDWLCCLPRIPPLTPASAASAAATVAPPTVATAGVVLAGSWDGRIRAWDRCAAAAGPVQAQEGQATTAAASRSSAPGSAPATAAPAATRRTLSTAGRSSLSSSASSSSSSSSAPSAVLCLAACDAPNAVVQGVASDAAAAEADTHGPRLVVVAGSTLHCHPRLRRRVLPLALRHCRRLRDLPDDGLGTPPLDAHNFVVMVAAAAKAACLDAGVPPDPPRTIRERGRIYDPLTDGAPAFFRHISTMLPLLADRPFLGMPARTPFLADARRLSIRGTVATTVLFAPPSLSQPQSFPSLRVLRLDLAGLSDWAVETFGALRPLDLGVTSLTIRAQPAAVVATLRHLPALRALVLPLQLDLADARVIAAAAPATIEYLAVADGSWLQGLVWLFPHLRHLKAKFDAISVGNYFRVDYRGASQVPFTPTLCSFESTFPGQAPDLSPATFALLASLEVLGPVSVGYGDGADAAAGLSAADLAALVQVVARLPRLRWVRVAVDEPPTLSTTSRSSRPTFALGNDKKASNADDDDDAVWLWFLQFLYQKRHGQCADAPAATGSGHRRAKLVVQFNRRMSAAVWARAAALGIDLWPPEHWTWPSVAFEVGGDDDARSDKPCSQCSGLF
ncbi:hypothetical protein HK405_002788 [Cladochytrium tenue]|nr:hypothetical protein HK405_002788 [Cladochytrium tenue]